MDSKTGLLKITSTQFSKLKSLFFKTSSVSSRQKSIFKKYTYKLTALYTAGIYIHIGNFRIDCQRSTLAAFY